jgi:hypothetical protein
MAVKPSPIKKTPPKHEQTGIGLKGDMEYPQNFAWQCRDGSTPWVVNNTKGNEFILVQHRSGSYWEMGSGGAFSLVASKNREDITFGKHVTYTTGAHDITVDGDSSVKTKGTRRVTTDGDSEQTTKGKSVVTAKSINMTAGEHIDMAGQSFTSKTKSALIQATDGAAVISAVGNAALSSKEGSAGIQAEAGAVTVAAGLSVSVKGNEVHISGAGGEIVMKEGKVYINSGRFQSPEQVWRGRPQGTITDEA